jgi:hypothetical protein
MLCDQARLAHLNPKFGSISRFSMVPLSSPHVFASVYVAKSFHFCSLRFLSMMWRLGLFLGNIGACDKRVDSTDQVDW